MLAGGFALLFLIILISNKGKRIEHWLLVSLLFLSIIGCYYIFQVYHNDGTYYVPVFSEINYAIPILYGLLLWLYAKSLLIKDYKLGGLDILHFIPFVVFLIFLFLTSTGTSNEEALRQNGYPLIKLVINPLYLFATLYMLLSTKKKLYNQYSYDVRMHHYWLSWVTGAGIVLWLVALAGYIYSKMNGYQTNVMGDYFLIGFLAVFLFILAYVGFNRTKIFLATEDQFDYDLGDTEPAQVKESPEQNIELQTEYQALLSTMEAKKPYLDQQLSLQKLSDIANISSGKLSTIINTFGNQNFYDFVNGYRVEEVKNKLRSADMEVYSILGIAEECGFNSKASFNRVFKKIEGQTPTQYLKNL